MAGHTNEPTPYAEDHPDSPWARAHGREAVAAALGTNLYDCPDWDDWKAHHDRYGRACDACGSYTYRDPNGDEPTNCAACGDALPGGYVHLVITMNDATAYEGASDMWAVPEALKGALEPDVTREDEDDYGLGVPVRIVTLSGHIDAGTLAKLRDEWSLDPDDSEPNLGFLGDLGDGVPRIYPDERHTFGSTEFNVGGWSPVIDVTLSLVTPQGIAEASA